MSEYEVAKQVIDGKWGNNEDRINRLTKAGYDAKYIQTIVNNILAGKLPEERVKEIEVDCAGYDALKVTVIL